MHFAFHMPQLPTFVNKFSEMVRDLETCRNAVNRLPQLTIERFRNMFSIWTMDPEWQRLMTPKAEPPQPMNGLNPWGGFVQALNDAGKEVQINMPETCSHVYLQKHGSCRLKFGALKQLLASRAAEE